MVELQQSTKQEMLPSAGSTNQTRAVNQNLYIVYFKIIEKHLVGISDLSFTDKKVGVLEGYLGC